MCGIAGIVATTNSGLKYINPLRSMLATMEHRGPDATYHYVSPQVAIGMTRLSIVGVDNGAQPIWNEDHTCAVICNGEIYNHKALRTMLELHGHVFTTDSDIEVIIHLYEEYGDDCLSQLEGIFGVCIWDATRQRLLIARDRVGVKPLYYVNKDETFAFASELRALLSFVEPKLSMSAFTSYHELRFAPAPYTLIEGIEKLPPAHFAVIQGSQFRIQGYWKPTYVAPSGVATGLIEIRQQEVRRLVEDAVTLQRAEEVPSAVLLSGGLDSTLLVALQTKLSGRAPDTITVGFTQPERAKSGNREYDMAEYDEHSFAFGVARQFGCTHYAKEFGPEETWDMLPRIVRDLDEPIADPTALPLWFASRVAHEAGHKVLFSGEGMDELFAGYDLYQQTRWLKFLQAVPVMFRKGLQSLLSQAKMPGSHVLSRSMQPVTKWYRSIGELFTQAEMQSIFTPAVIQKAQSSSRHWSDNALSRFLHLRDFALSQPDPLQQMLLFDCLHWLPENTLTKSDKISMAHSIELRVPFLNERLFEYALALPGRDKLRGSVNKYIVRKAFEDVIPSEVMNRPKAGFPVPITAWIFGEWNEQIRGLLLSSDSLTQNLYQKTGIAALLSSPSSQQRRAARLLWSLITMELWLHSVVEQTGSNPRQNGPQFGLAAAEGGSRGGPEGGDEDGPGMREVGGYRDFGIIGHLSGIGGTEGMSAR